MLQSHPASPVDQKGDGTPASSTQRSTAAPQPGSRGANKGGKEPRSLLMRPSEAWDCSQDPTGRARAQRSVRTRLGQEKQHQVDGRRSRELVPSPAGQPRLCILLCQPAAGCRRPQVYQRAVFGGQLCEAERMLSREGAPTREQVYDSHCTSASSAGWPTDPVPPAHTRSATAHARTYVVCIVLLDGVFNRVPQRPRRSVAAIRHLEEAEESTSAKISDQGSLLETSRLEFDSSSR